MKNPIRKLFGGLNLTWPKVIIAAIAAGMLTAAAAMIPALQYTSFHAIAVTLELWILFGIVIIMNSRSNWDSAWKCLVFFLISQPLAYLIQVPFSSLGFGLFGYYKFWFVWTILCFPMGFIGYTMKKGKWWGYLILLPMIALTALSYRNYFSDLQFYMPKYILICLFCACAMILYPVAIFDDKKIKTVGAAIGAAAVIVLTVMGLMNPPIYSAMIMANSAEHPFDDTCTVSLAGEKYGSVEIVYMDSIEDYTMQAAFKRAGHTVLTLESPSGDKTEYDLSIERDTYELVQR